MAIVFFGIIPIFEICLKFIRIGWVSREIVLSQTLAHFKKPLILMTLILLFFTLMSRIDYIVHATLYEYGLQFSYDWANSYWFTYNTLFVLFAVMAGVTYWFASNRTYRALKLSLALFGTILFLAIGGLQDILYFTLWGGGLPPTSVVWWWVPWANILGTWNSLMQISFTIIMSITSILTYSIAAKTPNHIPP